MLQHVDTCNRLNTSILCFTQTNLQASHLYYPSPLGLCRIAGHEPSYNIHSHFQVNTLSKVHAEPKQMCTASKANAYNSPQTGVQAQAHATPAKAVRLAFCCYCNSVILHCWRPNGGRELDSAVAVLCGLLIPPVCR